VSGEVKQHVRVLGPLDCKIATKLARRSTCLVDAVTAPSGAGAQSQPPCEKEGDLTFKLNGELLHGGQDKDNTIVNVNCTYNPTRELDVQSCNTDGLEGLHLPRNEETGGAIHGDNRTQIQKENKHCWRLLKAEQNEVSQWATHQGTDDGTPAIHLHSPIEYRNSMCPTG
jgi:hypothetical protein